MWVCGKDAGRIYRPFRSVPHIVPHRSLQYMLSAWRVIIHSFTINREVTKSNMNHSTPLMPKTTQHGLVQKAQYL